MTRKVKKGKNDFRPSFATGPLSRDVIAWELALSENCWYNNLGEDNFDVNKGPGIYRFWDLAKNKNAIIIGWRPHLAERGKFELIPYENRKGGNFPAIDNKIIVSAGIVSRGTFERENGKWKIYKMGYPGSFLWYASQLDFSVYGKIDGWFGGTSKAPQDMSKWLVI